MIESQTNNAYTAQKASLQQRDFLWQKLKVLNPAPDPDKFWQATEGLTEGKYKYLLALYYNDHEKLADELRDLEVI